MKITNVETIWVDTALYVRITTDEGITGLGESGVHGYQKPTEEAVKMFGNYLVGEDPTRIEHHWHYMYRSSHFRGSAVMGAISAIDIALWDIVGKKLDQPVYNLLGGKTRDKCRVYKGIPVFETTEGYVKDMKERVRQGWTALGHLSPFVTDSFTKGYSRSRFLKDATDRVCAYRDAVGDDIDLCIEIHRQLEPADAISLGLEIEKYRPFFYEDPIPPDNFDAMAYVASKINIPIATGERLMTVYEFQQLFTRNACQFARVDVPLAGGISVGKKIAGMAEAHYVNMAPHNPLSAISTAAEIQLNACIPNFGIQEAGGWDKYPDAVKVAYKFEKGYLTVPDENVPGIGAELVDKYLDRYPRQSRGIEARRTKTKVDGSIIVAM
jgi:galactonate dehydratase